MTCPLTIDSDVQDLAVGLVEAAGITIAPPDTALTEHCRSRVAHAVDVGPEGGDERRQAVRRMLRAGGFKPSGRNKPAQEYLARTAVDAGPWPVILNAVDVLNVISLSSGLPISLLSLERAGSALLVRYGAPCERFVFNASAQELDVEGLLSICRYEGLRTIPIGTPVKDSQFAKVVAGDQHVLACLYAPQSAVSAATLSHWSHELAAGLRTWCAAQDIAVRLVPSQW
ncbi:MAG: hypothetical protein ACYC3X_02675 [Pirellulaceae bacterium]